MSGCELNRIICGDALTVLKTMPDESVHCIVTSPPYWGLRDYGIERQLGLEKTPEEYVAKLVKIFREVRRVLRKDGIMFLNMGDSYAGSGHGYLTELKGKQATNRGSEWLVGQPPAIVPRGLKSKDLIGMPWRVAFALQADGWWLRLDIIWAKPNPMPESVSGSRWERHRIKVRGQLKGNSRPQRVGKRCGRNPDASRLPGGNAQYENCPGCDKCNPNDGLVLRMSAGRPTKSHEYVFLLTKSASYYYDQQAIRELQKDAHLISENYGQLSESNKFSSKEGNRSIQYGTKWQPKKREYNPAGRNARSVWTIATQPFPEAHFATFPEKLVKPCIKAGTSEKGCCPKCGAGWARIIEKHNPPQRKENRRIPPGQTKNKMPLNVNDKAPTVQTLGWRPSCECFGVSAEQTAWDVQMGLEEYAPTPCVVLDPFIGSGTTALVAKGLGRNFIGIELNPEYVEMANRRLAEAMPFFEEGD